MKVMKRVLVCFGVAVLAAAPAPAKSTTSKAKPKRSVAFAKTWRAAVKDAAALNVPIIVHRHGFY